jgi:hypothetical protein
VTHDIQDLEKAAVSGNQQQYDDPISGAQEGNGQEFEEEIGTNQQEMQATTASNPVKKNVFPGLHRSTTTMRTTDHKQA